MKVTTVAIGRLKAGPERDIAERLSSRAVAAGRKIGLSFESREFPESRAASPALRKEQEASAILAAITDKAIVITLDEKGKTEDSRAFAERLRRWRDDGTAEIIFAIGGPDGHGDPVVKRADLSLAFGPMTWPHQLVRLMLAEQLYRSVTILSGHPYHRD